MVGPKQWLWEGKLRQVRVGRPKLPLSLPGVGSGQSLQELCRSQSNGAPGSGHLQIIQTDHSPTPVTPGPTTHPEAVFSVSTIIPGFLYLGSEPGKESDYKELEELGVKQVLNLALECTDEEEECRKRFQKYHFLPLRDFVEEVGVQARIEEANILLDDASLHSAPVYVHCKAGKSRSVTIVIAYLIHRFRWSLKRAYDHVSDHRKGVSPNIGFLSELMKFAERQLGVKSSGILGTGTTPATAGPQAAQGNQSYFEGAPNDHATPPRVAELANPSRRRWNRDSLPMGSQPASEFSGDMAMEVRSSTGGWIHARQDPFTGDRFLLPRRQSKAGLESVHQS